MSIPLHLVDTVVIRRPSHGIGMGSHILTALGWIDAAEQNHQIPVIDFTPFKDTYALTGLDDDPWCSFFNQPGGVGLSESRLRLSCIRQGMPPSYPNPNSDIYNSMDEMEYWRKVARNKLTPSRKLNTFTLIDASKIMTHSSDKILGVLARGTDYTARHPKYHSIQPSINQLVSDVRDTIRDEGFSKVYLVSEDRSIIDSLANEFGDSLIVSHQPRVNYSGSDLLSDVPDIKHNEDIQFCYLASLINLSRCQGILAGRTSGTLLAMLMSYGFEYQHIYNLGTWN